MKITIFVPKMISATPLADQVEHVSDVNADIGEEEGGLDENEDEDELMDDGEEDDDDGYEGDIETFPEEDDWSWHSLVEGMFFWKKNGSYTEGSYLDADIQFGVFDSEDFSSDDLLSLATQE